MPSPRIIKTKWLGTYIDGWADLIEGMGEKVVDVKTQLLKILHEKNIPEVIIEEVMLEENGPFESTHRDYSIVTKFPGVTTTIDIEKHGVDLFTSWRSFIRPIIDWPIIILLAFTSVVLAFLWVVLRAILGLFLAKKVAENLLALEGKSIEYVDWIITGVGLIFLLLIILIVLGKIDEKMLKRGDLEKYGSVAEGILQLSIVLLVLLILLMATSDSPTTVENQYSLQMLIYQAFAPFKTKPIMIVVYSFSIFPFLIIGAFLAGLIIKRDPFAYVTVKTSMFVQENIAAMNLAVHKSLLRALDEVGIESAKLRLKQEFNTGKYKEKV